VVSWAWLWRSGRCRPRYEITNSNYQTQNSKQIEKFNNYNVSNSINGIHSFGFFDFEIYIAPICFGFRDSDFEFYMTMSVARENFLKSL
jgi:hypothetical protein